MKQGLSVNLIAATIGVAIGFAISTGSAQAAVYDFTFTDQIATATTPGIAVGDPFVVHLFADNGGSSLVSQTWVVGDTMGFTIDAGTYHASYSQVWTGGFDLRTDASGNVSVANFYGTEPTSSNTDNFGSWIADTVFGDGSFTDYNGNTNTILAGSFTNPSAWTVAAAVPGTTPIPASLPLFVTGLGGLGLLSRYRKRIAQSRAA